MIRYEPVVFRDSPTMKKPNELSCKNRVCYLVIVSEFAFTPFFRDSYRHVFEN